MKTEDALFLEGAEFYRDTKIVYGYSIARELFVARVAVHCVHGEQGDVEFRSIYLDGVLGNARAAVDSSLESIENRFRMT